MSHYIKSFFKSYSTLFTCSFDLLIIIHNFFIHACVNSTNTNVSISISTMRTFTFSVRLKLIAAPSQFKNAKLLWIFRFILLCN